MIKKSWPDHIVPDAPIDARMAKPVLVDGSYVVTDGHVLVAWDSPDREADEAGAAWAGSIRATLGAP